jgi:hypothetical protein
MQRAAAFDQCLKQRAFHPRVRSRVAARIAPLALRFRVASTERGASSQGRSRVDAEDETGSGLLILKKAITYTDDSLENRL